MSNDVTPVTPEQAAEGLPPVVDPSAADSYVEQKRAERATERAAKPAAEEPETKEPKSAEETPGTGNTPEAKADGATDPKVEEPPKKRGSMQARLNAEIAKTKAERESREKLEREIAELRAKPTHVVEPVKEAPKPVVVSTDVEPDEALVGTDKYPKWEDWNKAHTKWEVREEYRQIRAEEAAESAERTRVENEKASKAAQEANAKFLEERTTITLADIEAFKETAKDFDDVMAAATKQGLRLPDATHQAILELDAGQGAVYYYLAQNPAESKRIAGLLPSRQAKAIGDLADRLTADSDSDDEDEETGAASERGPVHRPKMVPVKPAGTRSLSAAPPLSEVNNADEHVMRRRRERAMASRVRRGSRG